MLRMRRPASRTVANAGIRISSSEAPLRDLLLEHDRLRGEFLIGELLDPPLHIVDGRDQRAHRLDFALVLGAENLGQHLASIAIIEPPVFTVEQRSGCEMRRIQQRSWERCCDRGEKGRTVWLVTIQSECLKGVSARAAKGKTACGEGRSARTLRADDSAIGVTTDSSRRVRELDLCSFDTAGPVAMAADRAERPSSGAKRYQDDSPESHESPSICEFSIGYSLKPLDNSRGSESDGAAK